MTTCNDHWERGQSFFHAFFLLGARACLPSFPCSSSNALLPTPRRRHPVLPHVAGLQRGQHDARADDEGRDGRLGLVVAGPGRLACGFWKGECGVVVVRGGQRWQRVASKLGVRKCVLATTFSHLLDSPRARRLERATPSAGEPAARAAVVRRASMVAVAEEFFFVFGFLFSGRRSVGFLSSTHSRSRRKATALPLD